MSTTLYTPPDVYAANTAWGASCGPGALAALLREPVMGLRALFPRPWTTPTVMGAALRARSIRTRDEYQLPLDRVFGRGLAFLQLQGRWDNAPVRVQYQHTHWISFHRLEGLLYVYDVNAGDGGGWSPFKVWRDATLREICARHRGASGVWYPRLAMEVLDG